MEKICARCQFRNPPVRGVCQVCGFAKFHCVGAQPIAIAKEPQAPLLMVLNQTIAAAAAAIQKIAETHKHAEGRDRDLTLTKPPKSAPAINSEMLPSFESNDLDSMIAWFKSYGVDKPLILDERKSADRSRAA